MRSLINTAPAGCGGITAAAVVSLVPENASTVFSYCAGSNVSNGSACEPACQLFSTGMLANAKHIHPLYNDVVCTSLQFRNYLISAGSQN